MKIYPILNKEKIASFLQRNRELYLYALGDLDDFFWPNTKWYGLEDNEKLLALAFLYTGGKSRTLLGFCEDTPSMKELLSSLIPFLPGDFHAQLSSGLEDIFEGHYHREEYGTYTRMILKHPEIVLSYDCRDVLSLSEADLQDIEALYRDSYPENWFDPCMLRTGKYFGVRKNGKLVSIAGIHVFSEQYQVAALGNITTHPLWRGKGFGAKVTARVCQSLIQSGLIKTIGLNVKTNNLAAIPCYQKLGFNKSFDFNEYIFYRKGSSAL